MTSTDKPHRGPLVAGDRGFTLLEVMVVVLVIGILLAVGIPTYLGARSRAQDKAAQSSLRVGQTTALIIFSDNGDFGEADTTALGTAEPSLTWNNSTTQSDDDLKISVDSSGTTEWGGAAMSDSGTCFYIRVSASGPTRYGSSTSSACTGAQALLVTDASW